MIIYCENGHSFNSKNIKDKIKSRKIIDNSGQCKQLYFECGTCRSKQHITFLNEKTESLQKRIDECYSRNELGSAQDLIYEKAQIIDTLKQQFSKFINDWGN